MVIGSDAKSKATGSVVLSVVMDVSPWGAALFRVGSTMRAALHGEPGLCERFLSGSQKVE
jgi:hypothetical protein